MDKENGPCSEPSHPTDSVLEGQYAPAHSNTRAYIQNTLNAYFEKFFGAFFWRFELGAAYDVFDLRETKYLLERRELAAEMLCARRTHGRVRLAEYNAAKDWANSTKQNLSMFF